MADLLLDALPASATRDPPSEEPPPDAAALAARCEALALRVRELERERDELRTVFDAVRETVLLLDDTGLVLAANDVGAGRLGLPPSGMVGRRLEQLFAPEVAATRRAHLEEALAKGRSVVWRDQREGRWYENECFPIPGSGPPRRAAVFGRDVTERREAEIARTRSEGLLRRAQELARLGTFVFDLESGAIERSAMANELFGLDPAEPHDRTTWSRLVHPDDAAAVTVARERSVARGEPLRVQYRIRRPSDGEERWIAANGAVERDADGRMLVVGCAQDVTDRHRAEERLESQAALLDLAQDAISVRDLDGRITYWNKSSERITGWPSSDAVGRSVDELFSLDAAVIARAEASVAVHGHWLGELDLARRDGRRITLTSRWTLVRDAAGAPRAVLVIETDVTEQKALHAQFLRAQRLESIGALASGIAHDLNNLLAPILMAGSSLTLAESPEEIEESAEIIETSARRCSEVVRQLLTFGRGAPPSRAPEQVGALVADVLRFAQQTFPRSIVLDQRVAPGLPAIAGDATQLHQVLLNLAINARDAMRDGGALRIAVDEAVVDAQYATMSPDAQPGRYVRIEVADTGGGIPPEHLDKIFDPYFTTKETGKGTGLGLFTVAGIVRAHGGFLRLYSQLGEGARFEVYLPSIEPTEGADGEAPTSAGLRPLGAAQLVLVVDDEAAVRAALRLTLERRGYRVVLAADGAEALALLAGYGAEIRAVVTDLMMPRMDGVAFAREALATRPGLPIAVSSGLLESQRQALEALGIRTFLAKPYAAAPLLATVAALLASTDAAEGAAR